MKNIKKIIIGVLTTFTIVSLFACGVNKKFANVNNGMMKYASYDDMSVTETAAAGFTRASMKQMATADMVYEMEEAAPDINSSESGKKLIKNIDIVAETKNFDNSISWIKSHIESVDGVIDNSYIDSGNKVYANNRKSANFSVRIPVEKSSDFLLKIGTELNITFEQESIRDVTDNYNDTEARIETLKIEEKKLNELLKKAKSIEDIIKIEEKLSEVRNELRNISNRLKRLDKQIDYDTYNITINEVVDLTEYIEKEDLSKENLKKQLIKNFEATKRFIVKTGVYLFVHIPAICFGLIVIVVILIFILIIMSISKSTKIKKKKVNNENKKSSENTTQEKVTDNDMKNQE